MKSTDLLDKCKAVQSERGAEYDTEQKGERSFQSVATAFNAITGKDITAAEVCLMLQLVKDVRQWSQDRLHEDSVLDGVSYASLKGEELYRQYQAEPDSPRCDMCGGSMNMYESDFKSSGVLVESFKCNECDHECKCYGGEH